MLCLGCISIYRKLRKYCNFGPNILDVRSTSFQRKRLNDDYFRYSLWHISLYPSSTSPPPSPILVSADVILLPVSAVRNKNKRSMQADEYSLMCLVGEINETRETPVAIRFVIYRVTTQSWAAMKRRVYVTEFYRADLHVERFAQRCM